MWENQGFTACRRATGFCLSLTILFFVLAFTYSIQFKMQKTVAFFDNFESYDCDIFSNSIGLPSTKKKGPKKKVNPSLFTIADYDYVRYQREAFSTWKNFYQPAEDKMLLKRYINGTLGCFCDQQFNTYNVLILFMNYRADGLDQDADAYNDWYNK